MNPAPPVVREALAPCAPAPVTQVVVSSTTPLSAQQLWSECTRLSAPSRRLRMIVEDSTLVSFASGTATISVGAHVAGLAKNSVAELADLFSRAAGSPIKIVMQDAAPADRPPPQNNGAEIRVRSPGEPATSGSAEPPVGDPATSLADVRVHPLVKQAEELFGARVVRVDPPRPA